MNFSNNNTLTLSNNTAGSVASSRKAKTMTSEPESEHFPTKMQKPTMKRNGSTTSRSSSSSGSQGSQSSSGGKNRGKNRGKANHKHRRLSNGSSAERDNKRQKLAPMDLEPVFPKLDQSDPAHARRIQQRRKTIAIGKNTAGYFQYTKQVPKNKRKIRSMETPATPDHTLDIPAKRWQGMVKAWRKALHQYDPPELAAAQQSMTDSVASKAEDANKIEAGDNFQTRQIKDALAKGLLVDVTTPAKPSADDEEDMGSPFSVLSGSSPFKSIMDVDDGDVDLDGGDDSDDDLL